MAFKKGEGGRTKGSQTLKTKLGPTVRAIANNLGVEPAEILLRFAANDWEGLGYASPMTPQLAKDGTLVKVERIETMDRIVAAKALCDYLYPKKRAIEVTGADGKDLFENFNKIVKSLADEGKIC